jgi:iron complex outermembrane receptor protein
LLNPLLDAIRSTTYEVGFKSVPSMGDRSVVLGYDIALYDIEVTNEIVPYNGGRYYLTAAGARRYGAEVGLNVRSRAGLFGNAALTFSKKRYQDYDVDSAVIIPTDPTKAGKRADYSSNDVVGVPSTLANVELGTEVPGMRALRLKAGVEHSGKYFADDANRVEVPSYTLLNLTAELRDPIAIGGNFGVRGFVTLKNVTDKRYIGSAFLNPDLVGGAPAAFEPGMPRAFVVSLSLGRLR